MRNVNGGGARWRTRQPMPPGQVWQLLAVVPVNRFLVTMRRNEVLTTPNLISLSRLAMAGVFLGVRDADWRLAVVLLAMVSDVLDGVVARISHSTS